MSTHSNPSSDIIHADAFHIYYCHTQAIKGMSSKEVQQKIQETLLTANEQTQKLVTDRVRMMQDIDKKLRALYESVTSRLRGERALLCLKASWGGVFVQCSPVSKPGLTCCISHTKCKQLYGVSFLYETKDGADITDVFYVKQKWIPLIEGFIFLSHMKGYCQLDAQHANEADLLRSFNACAKAVSIIADQL
jgi:hypothetical protein